MLYEKGKMTINEAMKWPTDKARYDANYETIFSKKCLCGDKGYYVDNGIKTKCLLCEIQKPKIERNKNV